MSKKDLSPNFLIAWTIFDSFFFYFYFSTNKRYFSRRKRSKLNGGWHRFCGKCSDFQDFRDPSRLVWLAFRGYARRSNLIARALMRFVIRGYDYNVACAIRRVLATRQWCMRQAWHISIRQWNSREFGCCGIRSPHRWSSTWHCSTQSVKPLHRILKLNCNHNRLKWSIICDFYKDEVYNFSLLYSN